MYDRTKWISFIAIILGLGAFGYILGARNGKSELFASGGVLVGFIICLIVWLLMRKKIKSESDSNKSSLHSLKDH